MSIFALHRMNRDNADRNENVIMAISLCTLLVLLFDYNYI